MTDNIIDFAAIQKVNAEIKTTDVKGKEYAEVNQRIIAFRKLFPEGSITTEIIKCDDGLCIMRATVANESGRILGTGTAYEKENSTFINKTSYIENCETSAIGRALGMVGIGINTSIASYEEVANAIKQQESFDDVKNMKIAKIKVSALQDRCMKDGVDESKITELYKVNTLYDLTELQYRNINDNWQKILDMK